MERAGTCCAAAIHELATKPPVSVGAGSPTVVWSETPILMNGMAEALAAGFFLTAAAGMLSFGEEQRDGVAAQKGSVQ